MERFIIEVVIAMTLPEACAEFYTETCQIVEEALATPCPRFESDSCYWDAQGMGNGKGKGTAFVALPYWSEEDQKVYDILIREDGTHSILD